jgi:hypothetical protein
VKALDKVFKEQIYGDHEGADQDERAERKKAFNKKKLKTLDVSLIEIPNDYSPLDYDKFQKLLPDIEQRGIRKRIQVSQRGDR